MRKEFMLLEEVIEETTKKGPVYYIANPGNLGDSLIRYGAKKFFQDIGLKHTELKSFNTSKRHWWPFILAILKQSKAKGWVTFLEQIKKIPKK